jgi:hypothetical protein
MIKSFCSISEIQKYVLPARLDVTAPAKLLSFTESDMQILMSAGKLTPLGNPAPNAPKWFAAVEMIRLATDQDCGTRPQMKLPNTGESSEIDRRLRLSRRGLLNPWHGWSINLKVNKLMESAKSARNAQG